MKPLAGYSEAKVTSGVEKLPKGGYVLKILGAKEEHYDWGDVIVLRFDIAEGEFKGHFQERYENRYDENEKWKGTYRLNVPSPKSNSEEDQKKYKRQLGFFKSQIEAINKSNNINIDCSKEWDVSILKGRLGGAVYNEKEYDYNGSKGFFANCHHLAEVEKIRSGDFKVPEATLLKNDSQTASSPLDVDKAYSDFVEIDDSDVPF